jgi:hypothetical protein
MIKLILLACTIFLFSCGRNTTVPLVTYNVPGKYYDIYKSELDKVAAEITSKTGKQLVKFIRNDKLPTYETFADAYSNYSKTKEAWVFIKEDKDWFTDISDDAAGVAYVGTSSKPLGAIVLNFSISMSWNNHNFHQVLAHEVLHSLGYDHTFDTDYSIMNYNYVYGVNGITSLDHERLATDFPFSLEVVTIKDLEKIAAFDEREASQSYAYQLMENFGLSESRAQTISRHLISFRKLNTQRELTSREKDIFTKEVLGFGYEKGKAALENYIQGEKEALDDLIEVAASRNETSPEHIKELFGELFLK